MREGALHVAVRDNVAADETIIGEAYVDASTTEELLHLARDRRQPGTGVVVREYTSAAA